jgi:hypothetical protein
LSKNATDVEERDVGNTAERNKGCRLRRRKAGEQRVSRALPLVYHGVEARSAGDKNMHSVKVVVWEEEGGWLGYLQDYPDYHTQGTTHDDLKKHLRDLYRDVTSGKIPGIRRVEDLIVP